MILNNDLVNLWVRGARGITENLAATIMTPQYVNAEKYRLKQ